MCNGEVEPFRIKYPKIVGIKLTGKLNPWVSAKDVILEVLTGLTSREMWARYLNTFGDGVKTLSVPDRATEITNMGTETGCTTSIFPSDEVTRQFLIAQGQGRRTLCLLLLMMTQFMMK